MLKKNTLLAVSIAALLVFVVPSMATAHYWRTGGELIGGAGQKDTVHFTGTLTATKGPLKFSCNATSNITLWNTVDTGTGEMDSLDLTEDPVGTGACTAAVSVAPNTYVDVSGCHAQGVTANFPWHITGQPGTILDIDGVDIAYILTGCRIPLGIPDGTEIAAKGTVTGISDGANCINFTKAGDIPQVDIDGALCATGGELESSE